MNGHALHVLEFERALAAVSRHASTPLGAGSVRELRPSDALAWVEAELRRVDQMVAFLDRNPDWVILAIPDLRLPLQRLAVEGSAWEGRWLRQGADLLASARQARTSIMQDAADHPLLAGIADRLVRLDAEERRLNAVVDESGEVRDGASRELARLRRELRTASARIVQKLEAFVAQLPERIRVADASVSVRDGRYVVPVRREGRSEVGGIVHDESATGATLFVEPPLAVELMNRVRELELAEAREVQRILVEATTLLRPHRDALEATLAALVALDSLYARARYALERDGRMPALHAERDGVYEVVNGRHPLLLESREATVPFDLRLDAGERTLLVSGPNTGGKTVLLKAVGLISALTQAGVIPPVGPGTRLPVFSDIFADIGDEQSIEASLSTFSAHLRNLRDIVDHADAGTLVLVDEMGSGTDPAEGAALARAVLLELTGRGALTVATTHLGTLKGLASETPGLVNASLQFDAGELRPTFRLVKGMPGRSYGLAIARRLGFPERLLGAAESFLPAGEQRVGQLLEALEEKDRRASEALAAAAEARRDAGRMRDEAEERQARILRQEKELERRTRREAREILLSARAEVEQAIGDLRAAVHDADHSAFEELARETRRRVESAAAEQAERTPQPVASATPAADVAVGDYVRVAATGAAGHVVELREGRATVESGGLRLHVPATDLVPASRPVPVGPVRGEGNAWTGPDVEPVTEVDLRGLRAEEVQARLSPALDAAMRSELPDLRIIHGKGTGVLREVVAELLRSDPRVQRFRPGELGEGGTGVTVAEF